MTNWYATTRATRESLNACEAEAIGDAHDYLKMADLLADDSEAMDGIIAQIHRHGVTSFLGHLAQRLHERREDSWPEESRRLDQLSRAIEAAVAEYRRDVRDGVIS